MSLSPLKRKGQIHYIVARVFGMHDTPEDIYLAALSLERTPCKAHFGQYSTHPECLIPEGKWSRVRSTKLN